MHFNQPTVWLMGICLALAACAAVPPPEYAGDHPANPGAPEASERHTPGALASYQRFGMENKPRPEADRQPDPGPAKDPAAPAKESGHEHVH